MGIIHQGFGEGSVAIGGGHGKEIFGTDERLSQQTQLLSLPPCTHCVNFRADDPTRSLLVCIRNSGIWTIFHIDVDGPVIDNWLTASQLVARLLKKCNVPCANKRKQDLLVHKLWTAIRMQNLDWALCQQASCSWSFLQCIRWSQEWIVASGDDFRNNGSKWSFLT